VTGHSYAPTAMEFGTQYFWKVNEVGDAGAYEGDVWSFTSQEFAALDDMESYNDDDNRVYDSWIDGWVNNTGSQVGYDESPFAEKVIVHGGKQSMPLKYDNTASPFYSETEREFATAQNCTGNGATELSVWTRGYPALASVPVTEAGGKISVTGDGADIWGTSDQFTYVYKTLKGDGSMVARVVSTGTGSNTWAKGGVMIRESLRGDSMHAMMVITTPGANGASFQYRAAAGGASAGTDSAVAVAPPYWVKIDRAGNNLTGYHSANGTSWSMVSSTQVPFSETVHIGLCVTSHAAGEQRTFDFDNVTAAGGVTGAWTGVVIESAQYNDAADMYLTVEDSAGKSATVTSSTAAIVADWTRWVIPFSDLAGVNMSRVKKLVIGVGNKAAPTAGGTGTVFIDDVGYGRSSQ